jgi:AcrR family transcriptional regulator
LQLLHNVNTINFMSTNALEPTKNTAYHHGNLRDALLKAAIEVMADTGVSQFSLSELARKVGVTPAAAYKHFADKETLLSELAQYGFSLLRERFEVAAPQAKLPVSEKQAIQRFERIGRAYVQFGLDEPALFNLIFGKGASSFRQKVAVSGERTPTFAYFANALEELHKFGVIAKSPNQQHQWFAWSAIHGATELQIAGISGLVSSEKSAHVITSNILRALR